MDRLAQAAMLHAVDEAATSPSQLENQRIRVIGSFHLIVSLSNATIISEEMEVGWGMAGPPSTHWTEPNTESV